MRELRKEFLKKTQPHLSEKWRTERRKNKATKNKETHNLNKQMAGY